MAINYAKTQAMHFHPAPVPLHLRASLGSRPALPSPIDLFGGQVEFVDRFVYLGSLITADGSLDAELARRTGLARAAMGQLSKLWRKRDVGTEVKMLVFRAFVPPVLLYGCESWALSTAQSEQLDVFLHECLRTVLGVRRDEHIYTGELRRRCCHQSLFSDAVSRHRLRFLGHVARRTDTRLPKLLLFAKHLPCERVERPRWGGEYLPSVLQEDLVQLGAAHDWYSKAQDRMDWRCLIAERFGGRP